MKYLSKGEDLSLSELKDFMCSLKKKKKSRKLCLWLIFGIISAVGIAAAIILKLRFDNDGDFDDDDFDDDDFDDDSDDCCDDGCDECKHDDSGAATDEDFEDDIVNEGFAQEDKQ